MALTGLTKIQKVGINTATIPTVGGVEGVGVITATNFIGDGSGLTGVTGSGAGVIVRDGGSLVGTAGTINFGTNLNVSAISAGIVTVTNAASSTSLTGLSDVTVTSASNGQILKHNGSVFVNTAERTYSQSSVASGSNVNLRLSDGSTDDDILITAGSNITFSSVSAGGFTIAASGGGGGSGISNVVEDTSPELGGNLNLNNKFITGSGGINVSGVTTSTSFVGNITGNVTGNTSGSSGSCTGNSATATTATNFNVTANNTADETVYPIFVDGATGAQGAETDSGLNYNPSTGNLTATKFTGSGVALSGVVTSIVAGSNITLTGGPTGIVTIASSGGGGGGISLSGGVDNRVVTASSASAVEGEANLTFNGTTLALTGSQTVSGSVVVGTAVTINSDGINGTTGVGITADTLKANNDLTVGGSIYGSTRLMFLGGGGTDLQYYAGGTAYSSHIFKLMQGGSTIERFRVSVDGGNLTGIMTATSFVGDLTGDVTGNADTATTATTATNVTVSANNSTNETVYPIFVDGATGAQGAESDTGLSYNPSSGALTSGSFVKSGGSSSQFLKADGSVDSNTYLTSGSYLENVSEDNSPQLGGDLDLNSKNITGTGEIRIVGLVTATSAVKTWTLGSSGNSHYTFTGDGFTSATNDPDIYLERGKRYAFLNNAGGTTHPFQIRVSNGGSAYTTGVTYHTEHSSGSNSASQGYITFNVPWDAPARLYYQCTSHSGMGGNIYIRGAGGGNDKVGVTTITGGLLHIKDNTSPAIRLQDNDNVNSDFKIYSPNGENHLRIYHENTSSDLVTLTSAGALCFGTYNSNFASNDGVVSIVNAASSGTENTLLTLWNPTTAVDSRAGIDFLTNAQYGTGRDGGFIRGSNDGVTAKANLQFGTIKDETYDTNFEIKSTGAVVISCDTGNTAFTLTPTASASTSMIFNTWADNTSGRNWAIRNRYNAHGRLEFMRGTNNTNDPLTTVMYLDGSTVHIAGTLSKSSGSFKIPHPLVGLSTTKDLVHSFIEGPQMDLIYRGKVTLSSGAATVNLDTVSNMTEGTFVVLNRDVQCFTTNETGWGAVKGSVSGNILTINAQDGSSTDTISWMVIGERQDDEIKSSEMTDDNGDLIVEPLKESVINN